MQRLLGNHPAVVLSLARLAALSGDTADALAQLRRIAAMGVTSRRIADSAFNRMRELPAFRAVAAQLQDNAATIGAATLVGTLPDSTAIAEDLGWEPSGSRVVVSDIRHRRLWTVGVRGDVRPLGPPLPLGMGVLGVAVDATRGAVWVTTVALPQAEGYAPADSGHAAILRFDVASGSVIRRYDLPVPTAAAPGDIAVAENHDVFAGDGQTGAVYVIREAGDSLETLVPPGRLRGTQQPAFSADHRFLFIPDYGRGIAKIDRATGAINWLGVPADVTVTGIDGLIARGRDLIAVQNGVVPNRVVRLVLDPAQSAIVRADILLRDSTLAPEPTHAVVANGQLYLIGSSGWRFYEDNGMLKADARPQPPAIVRVALPAH